MAAQMLAIMKGFVPLDRACADADQGRDVERDASLARVARAVDAALVSDPTLRTSSALDFARAIEARVVDSVATSGRSTGEKASDSVAEPEQESLAPPPEVEAKPGRAGLGAGAQAILAVLGVLALLAGGMRLRGLFREPSPSSATMRDVTAPSSSSQAPPVPSASSPTPVVVTSAPSAPPEPRPAVSSPETSKSTHGPSPVPSARVAPKASSAPIGDGLPIHL